MPPVKNMKQLEEMLNARMKKALKDTQKYIYDILKQTVVDFYHDYTPEQYERTYEFIKSVIKTDIKMVGNSAQCTVEVKREYLDYRYPSDKWYGDPVTGYMVADWAARGLHGGWKHGKQGKEFWMDNYDLFDKFLNEFKTNLELHGLTITK